MSIRMGVIMDPVTEINVKKDSTLAMLVAARARGWDVHYMRQCDLYLDCGEAMANSRRFTRVDYDHQPWYALDSSINVPLSSFDVLLMRKDPPFDNEYIYTTYLLEVAERAGALVVLADVTENGADFLQVRRVVVQHHHSRFGVAEDGAQRLAQFVREG